jgi:hypothetical protein
VCPCRSPKSKKKKGEELGFPLEKGERRRRGAAVSEEREGEDANELGFQGVASDAGLYSHPTIIA